MDGPLTVILKLCVTGADLHRIRYQCRVDGDQNSTERHQQDQGDARRPVGYCASHSYE